MRLHASWFHNGAIFFANSAQKIPYHNTMYKLYAGPALDQQPNSPTNLFTNTINFKTLNPSKNQAEALNKHTKL